MTETSPAPPLKLHARFIWKTGGATVHSQVQLFEPEQRIAWTGSVLTIRACHVWRLSPQGDGGTLVTTDESMDGLLIAFLFPSKKLAEADEAWLTSLKQAAEKPR